MTPDRCEKVNGGGVRSTQLISKLVNWLISFILTNQKTEGLTNQLTNCALRVLTA